MAPTLLFCSTVAFVAARGISPVSPAVLWILLVGGFIVVPLVLRKHFDKKRTATWTETAATLGMDFSAQPDSVLLSSMQAFKLFNRGRKREMRNVMKAETESAQLAVFDYRFTTGSGKNQTVHNHTLFAMRTDELHPPTFLLRPERLLDRMGSIVGGQDIDFDSHPRFSKQFVLQGENEKAVRQFFDGELLEYFEKNEGLYVESSPGAFIFFHRKLSKPKQVRDLMDQGYSTYAAIKDRLSRADS